MRWKQILSERIHVDANILVCGDLHDVGNCVLNSKHECRGWVDGDRLLNLPGGQLEVRFAVR